MIKRILTLVLATSTISAALLLSGTALMGKFSPALASSFTPLVAGMDTQSSLDNPTVNEADSATIVANTEAEKPALPSERKENSGSHTLAGNSQNAPAATPSAGPPLTGVTVTIAQLLANPGQYAHQVLTISGIVTRLDHEKFLINDGTGQILVEVDDDHVIYNILDGKTITVTGRLDDNDSQNEYEIDACSITDENGTFIVDDCTDDCEDCDDDCNGTCADDCVDDCSDCTDDMDDLQDDD
jgi:uncharacterized protein YdeI (BOF family)